MSISFDSLWFDRKKKRVSFPFLLPFLVFALQSCVMWLWFVQEIVLKIDLLLLRIVLWNRYCCLGRDRYILWIMECPHVLDNIQVENFNIEECGDAKNFFCSGNCCILRVEWVRLGFMSDGSVRNRVVAFVLRG